jgi:hypothetical protein
VTTTDVFNDKGEFVGNPAIVEPSLGDPVANFQKNVQVGTGGKGHEEAFEAARLAIAREQAAAADRLAQRQGCLQACAPTLQACADDCRSRYQPDFMRPEARLFLVFVSDEEEQSFGEVRFFERSFAAALGPGNESSVRAAAICGVGATPPCGAQPGWRYAALVEALGGVTESICDDSFADPLEQMAAEAVGLRRKFQLARLPLVDSLAPLIRYRCDTPESALVACASSTSDCTGQEPGDLGISCVPLAGGGDGWSFEPATRSLVFSGRSVPGLRSVLSVGYQVDEGG